MDAATSAAGATVEPENEEQKHVAKGSQPEIQTEKSKQEVEVYYRLSYSITARCRERATRAKELERAMEEWCQKETQSIKDVESIVSNILGFQSDYNRSGECSCTMCKAVANLKGQCERFITLKDECTSVREKRAVAAKTRAEVVKEAADAIREHVESVEEQTEALKKSSEALKECDHVIKEFAETLQSRAEALKEHSEAIKGYADATEEHADALQEHSQAIQDHAQGVKEDTEALKEHAQADNLQASLFSILSLAETVATRAKLISSVVGSTVDEAHHVARDAGLVAEARLLSRIEGRLSFVEGRVSSAADFVARKAELISVDHESAKNLVAAIRTPHIDIFAATWETDDTSDLELDKTRFNSPRSSPSSFDKLCDPPAIDFDNFDFFPSLENEQVQLLHQFFNHVKRIVGTASILDVDDVQYSQKIEATVAAIIGWDIRNEPVDLSTTSLYVPSCAARGSLGVKPILFAIMGKMAQVLGLGPRLAGEEGGPKVESRWGSCDGFEASSSAAEYLLVALPSMFGVPMVFSQISHRKGTLGQLLLEAQNKLVRDLGDQSMLFWDFGGLGVDCTLFGLEFTMGSIRVVVVKLSGVGTVDVNVTTERTTRLPLFDKETRDYLFGEKARDVKASFEGAEEEHRGMPAGFCMLARTMMSVQSGQGTSLTTCVRGCNGSVSMRSKDGETIKVGRYLESSTYSHVLELDIKGSNNVFIKVPKCNGRAKALECEAEALKDLFGHVCIPELYDIDDPIKTLDIRIRCESSILPCLPWKGFMGRPTSHKRSWESSHLKTIFKGVHSALLHAHSRGWAHLHVRPSKIITRDDPSGNGVQVMLIGWEDSSRRNEVLKGFCGAPAFAHDELFGRTEEWTFRPDHDLASLAYMMVYLSHGRVPWSGFLDGSAVSDDLRKDRFNVVSDTLKPLLREWDVSPDDEEALLKAIEYRESNSRKRKHD